jgi:diguanylate cyclase (GGDEF)-like protein
MTACSGAIVLADVARIFSDDRTLDMQRVHRERLRLLNQALPIVLTANLISGTLIAALFYERVASGLLFGWWLLLVTVVIARASTWWCWYRGAVTMQQNLKLWGAVFVAGSGVSGALWGSAGVLFYAPGDSLHLMLLCFVLGGMGAGALASLTPYVWALYAYLVPSLFPFALNLATDGDGHRVMAAMCMAYLLTLLFLGWRAHSWLVRSLIFARKHARLTRTSESRVAERTEEMREITELLYRDIAERQQAERKLSDYGQRQAAVAAFGQRVLAGVDLDRLFSEAVTLAATLLGVAGVTVLELSSSREALFIRAAAGPLFASGIQSPLLSANGSPGGVAVRQQAALISDDVTNEHRFALPEVLQNTGTRSAAVVVIANGRHTFGAFEAYDTQARRFSAADVSFLQSIANILATAIDYNRAQQDIRRLALEDSLTGLPNRSLFRHRLLQAAATAKDCGQLIAVLLLDLDHFRDVNDTLGHPSGDRLLAEVGARLRTCTQGFDPPARLGGDEFALIVPNLTGAEHAAAVARRLVSSIAEPFFVDGHEIRLGASIGITICPRDDDDPDNLLRNADLALYRAKEVRNMYQFYDAEMAAQVASRKALEHDLRHALTMGGLELYYQPQFDTHERRVAATEALLRWHHPKRGFLLPDAFIPIAERSGLIVPLGVWVLERACEQVSVWRQSGLPNVTMAVNLSPSQCRHGDLVALVASVAERVGCNLDWLELEVTEQLFMPEEGTDCIDGLRRLRMLGVTISIDDFGTGYSSLGRLHGLPVDKVKIDKCFVKKLGCSRGAELIVRAIIGLGRSLGVAVVAEGVENQNQQDFLIAEGCHELQGFHLAPPLPAMELARVLTRGFSHQPSLGDHPKAEATTGRQVTPGPPNGFRQAMSQYPAQMDQGPAPRWYE